MQFLRIGLEIVEFNKFTGFFYFFVSKKPHQLVPAAHQHSCCPGDQSIFVRDIDLDRRDIPVMCRGTFGKRGQNDPLSPFRDILSGNMAERGEQVNSTGVGVNIDPAALTGRKNQQGDMNDRLVEHRIGVPKYVAFKHFAMIGCQDDPGVA